MKCREFHRRMADWSRERLTDDESERMASHAAECRACAEEVAIERSLRMSFRVVEPITRTPDLWERIEARVETVKRPRFAFSFQRTFALGGALAAGILLVVMLVPRPGAGPIGPGVAQVDEGRAIQLISEMRVPEPSGAFTDTPFSGDAARMLLVGR